MKQQVFNPYLPSYEYIPDGEPRVFNGRLYIYGSHDRFNGAVYCANDYVCWSAPEDDLSDWRFEGVIYRKTQDPRNPDGAHALWAPDVCRGNDGKYYLYFPAKDHDGVFHIGVAVSDCPTGPFRAEENYMENSMSIDPAILADDDGRYYMYNGGLWGGQLEKWQTGTYTEKPRETGKEEPALGPFVAELAEDMKSFREEPRMVRILDENGEPLKAGDEDRRFFEGPWMHKYNGVYYLSYSTGTTHYICYATGEDPRGPFTYRGRILEPVIGWTTHHSIVEYHGRWYLFYHDCEMSGGINHRRNVKYTELIYEPDGSIRTIFPYGDGQTV
jgi:hypothetical protein